MSMKRVCLTSKRLDGLLQGRGLLDSLKKKVQGNGDCDRDLVAVQPSAQRPPSHGRTITAAAAEQPKHGVVAPHGRNEAETFSAWRRGRHTTRSYSSSTGDMPNPKVKMSATAPLRPFRVNLEDTSISSRSTLSMTSSQELRRIVQICRPFSPAYGGSKPVSEFEGNEDKTALGDQLIWGTRSLGLLKRPTDALTIFGVGEYRRETLQISERIITRRCGIDRKTAGSFGPSVLPGLESVRAVRRGLLMRMTWSSLTGREQNAKSGALAVEDGRHCLASSTDRQLAQNRPAGFLSQPIKRTDNTFHSPSSLKRRISTNDIWPVFEREQQSDRRLEHASVTSLVSPFTNSIRPRPTKTLVPARNPRSVKPHMLQRLPHQLQSSSSAIANNIPGKYSVSILTAEISSLY
ncbi:hypothetical protein V8F20_007606 [Naviculisporaceae sp. PSN 640]